jgi:undecaprenyl-diphosphatase
MFLNVALSFVGGPRFRAALVAVIAIVFALRQRWWSGLMLIAAASGMGAINTALKYAVRRRRPHGLPGLIQAGGYSFPSGHTSGSVVFLGALAYLTWPIAGVRNVTWAAFGVAGVLATLIGRSRIELKAHHTSDVVAGYAIGTAWLAFILRLFARRLAQEYQSAEP